jgi:hypothetical protein
MNKIKRAKTARATRASTHQAQTGGPEGAGAESRPATALTRHGRGQGAPWRGPHANTHGGACAGSTARTRRSPAARTSKAGWRMAGRRRAAAADGSARREARAVKGEDRGELESGEGMEEVLRVRGIGRR